MYVYSSRKSNIKELVIINTEYGMYAQDHTGLKHEYASYIPFDMYKLYYGTSNTYNMVLYTDSCAKRVGGFGNRGKSGVSKTVCTKEFV